LHGERGLPLSDNSEFFPPTKHSEQLLCPPHFQVKIDLCRVKDSSEDTQKPQKTIPGREHLFNGSRNVINIFELASALLKTTSFMSGTNSKTQIK